MSRGQRVGSIDDPIWGTPPLPDASRRRPNPRARRRAGTLLVLIAIVAAALLIIWRVESHSGGDPNNTVYTELKNTLLAMPPGLDNARLNAATPTGWVSGCPGFRASGAGWSQVYVSVDFADSRARGLVRSQINRALSRTGWVRHDERAGQDQGKLAHWFKDMSQGGVANIFAYPSRGAGHWSMTAAWQPPGPVGRECP